MVVAINNLLSSPIFGAILGIAGIALAVIFYLKSKQSAKLAHFTKDIAVIGGARAAFDDRLDIRFAGRGLERVTKTRTVLWNSGNITLDGHRVATNDPLRITVAAPNLLLQAEIVREPREVNNVTLSLIDEHSASLHFDFLDPRDGVVIEITHSGGRGDLEWAGTLRGMPHGFAALGPKRPRNDRRFVNSFKKIRLATMIAMVIVGTAFIVTGIFGAALSEAFPELGIKDEPSSSRRILMIFMGLAYVVMPASLLWTQRRRFPASLEVQEASSDQAKA